MPINPVKLYSEHQKMGAWLVMDGNVGTGRLKIGTRLVLSIVVPALVCFSLAGWFVLATMADAAQLQTETMRTILWKDVLAIGACFAVLLASVLLAARAVVKPIRLLTGYAERLAKGDTDFKVATAGRRDELGALSRSIRATQISLKKVSLILGRASGDILKGNISVRVDAAKYPGEFSQILDGSNKIDDSICGLIRNIKTAAESVAAVSQQISAEAQNVAQGAASQASAIEEVSATVTEVLNKTRSNADNAETTRQLSEKVSAGARLGSEKMRALFEALDAISRSSSTISSVIKMIEDIAFQTNILALNASVEAARAGVHGKGFSVVAEEVKNLANKSAAAARETNELLSDSIGKSELGLRIGREMEEALTEIVQSTTRSVDSISEIAEDCARQVRTIEQVNTGLGQISLVVQSNTATAEESAASSEEMAAQSALLMELVSSYKIDVARIVSDPTGFNEKDY